MAPRGAAGLLLPALTLAGTVVTAAVAYRLGATHAARRHRPSQEKDMGSDTTTSKPDAKKILPENKASASAAGSAPSASSLFVRMIKEDASLMMAAFGASIVGLAGVVSTVVVSMDNELTSVDELRMFSPLMVSGSVLTTVGLLNAMLRYSNRKSSAAPGEVVLPPGHPPIAEEVLKEMTELDENGQPKKRISRCPFGFT